MTAAIGLGFLLVTVIAFWSVLPRGGKVHRLVGTPWEPYFAILFVSGAALGFGLVVVWLADTLLR